jgi:diacylglycerol kinase (ATP)
MHVLTQDDAEKLPMIRHTAIKLKNNFIYSINGLRLALMEHSFVMELLFGLIFLPILIFIEIPIGIKLLLLGAYFLILVCELFNTAIEKLCNKITQEDDLQIKAIKDISSAAVFIAIFLFATILIFVLFYYQH